MPQTNIQIPTRQSAAFFWWVQNTFTSSELSRFLNLLSNQMKDGRELLHRPEKILALAASVLSEERQDLLHRAHLRPTDSASQPNLITKFEIELLICRRLPPDFPLALRYSGNPQLLALKRVGIVGSRHPTFYGREQAARFARTLAESGVCVVSGAAIGIDTVANLIGHNSGASVAVLGSGIGVPYPRANTALFRCMENSGRGLVLSEFPDQQRAEKWNFPKRNRIIAALCDFLMVIEAGVRSGTMITAQLAADIGVDVGALPGPVYSPTSQGSNLLIKDGAFCVENPEEILERLANLGHQKDATRETSTDDASVLPRTHPTLF